MKYKNPISFLIFFLLLSGTCFSQSIVNRANSSYTVQDARFSAQYNLFVPKYTDTTSINAGIDTCGAIVYLYSTNTLWYRSCAGGAKAWVDIGLVLTASEGITKVGSDFQLGGEITSNRLISWDGTNKNFKLNPSVGSFHDVTIESTDSIVNNPETDGEANTAAFAVNKTWKYPAYTSQYYRIGTVLQTNYEIKDSVRLNSYGGDFGASVRTDMNFTKMPGYSGRSVYVLGAQTLNDALPIHINYAYLGTTSTASNYKYLRGYLTANQSMLYIAKNDTIENWIGYNNMAGFFDQSHVKFSADYAGGYFGSASAARVANPWGVFIWNARSKNYFAGALAIGDSIVDPSAIVDISSTTKGMLPPRMSAAQRTAIGSPGPALFLWDNDSTRYMGYNGTSWKGIAWTGEGGGGGSGTVNSGTQYRLGYYATTGDAISEAPAITGDRALISDANGVPTHSATTATEIGLISGLTSNAQDQINGKATGSITQNWFDDDLTLSGVTTKINRADFFDDMLTAPVSNSGTTYMFAVVSGTGAAANIGGTVTPPNGDGWATITPGTTTTGFAALGSTSTSTSSGLKNKIDTTKTYRFETNLQIETLSDGTDRFRFIAGMAGHLTDAGGTNKIWFRYSDNVNSGNWTCYSGDGTTTESTNSGVAAAAGTTVRLGFEYDNAQIKFYINGSLVATHTTRLPEQNSAGMFPTVAVTKELGTTNRNIFIDWVKYRRL